MTGPTFYRPSDLSTDPSGIRVGGGDWKYLVDVLDGSHATDRLQIDKVEALSKIASPSWIVRKASESVYEGVRTRDGVVVSTSNTPDALTVLNDIVNHADFIAGDTIVIRPSSTPYYCGTTTAAALIVKSAVIFAYGVTLQVNANRSAAYMIRVQNTGTRLIVYGLIMDANYRGLEADGTTPKTGGNLYAGCIRGENDHLIDGIRCYDCIFKNIYNIAINTGITGAGSGHVAGSPLGACTVILERCSFLGWRNADNTTESQPLNEMITSNAINDMFIRDCYFDFNKPFYITARNVHLENVYCNTVGFTNVPEHAIHGEYITVRNLTVLGSGIKLRAWGAIHMFTLYGSCKRASIDGYYSTASGTPLKIEPYDSTTYRIENVVIKNMHCSTSGIRIANLTSDATTPKGKVDLISIENYTQQGFDANNCIVLVNAGCDIDSLKIDNVKVGASWASTGSPIRLVSSAYAFTIENIDIKNMVTEPPTNIVTLDYNNTGNTINATFRKPMDNGKTGIRLLNGATNSGIKFRQNKGTATITSGNTSVVVTHGLSYPPDPQDIYITPTNSPTTDPGHPWISGITSTQFTINVRTNPGASGASFAWFAGRD